MSDGKSLEDFSISRKSSRLMADEYLGKFDQQFPGLIQQAQRDYVAEDKRRRTIFYIGSAVIVAGAVLLWWLSNNDLTSVSPWSVVLFFVGLLIYNKWKKASARKTFRRTFATAGVTDVAYGNLMSAGQLSGLMAISMISADLGGGSAFGMDHGGFDGGGGGDVGGGGCGGCGGA